MTDYFTITICKPLHDSEIQEISEEFTISNEYLSTVKTLLVALELQTEGSAP